MASPVGGATVQLGKTEQWLHDKSVARARKMCNERFHEAEILGADGKWTLVVDIHAKPGLNGALDVRDMNTGVWNPIARNGWRHVRPAND
ncbi:hypothetical protein LCGC14_1196430 [marine sediment metagenome]|uniref:Uncharacterized protein n=1 Tax=marine sediment metagenome TaxID=412755 RepID=A0A0F9LID2_9ZZZZ